MGVFNGLLYNIYDAILKRCRHVISSRQDIKSGEKDTSDFKTSCRKNI